MHVGNMASELRRLGREAAGVVAIEYALIGAIIVLSIFSVLSFIGGEAMLGLRPIIATLQAIVS